MNYDIGKAFAAIEEELIASMMRNMKRHREWEDDEGFQWSMWQAEQLKALDKYKRTNKKKFERQFNEINGSIRMLIEQAREQGSMEQELEILEAIEKGWKPKRFSKNQMDISGEFFKLNTRKLEALIKATENDFQRAEVAMLRMADDQYRQVIFNAQVYANTGAGTYEQAVDMATKDFLSRGINCIQYANGARHTMKDYASMAIRTAAKRAYLAGEGEKRQEWGIDTVIVHKRGNPCPKCLPFVGKVLIDDVWSGGSSADGQKYPLMSTAVAAGLYHPNCKDAHSTYFPGISEPPDDVFTKAEIEDIKEGYSLDQRRNYAENQSQKYLRLAEYSLDDENKQKYKAKAEQWDAEKKKIDLYRARFHFVNELREDLLKGSHKERVANAVATSELIPDYKMNIPMAYDEINDRIMINPTAPLIEKYDLNFSYAHEGTHRLDVKKYHSWENKKFLEAIDKTAAKAHNMRNEIEAWCASGGKYAENMAMMDIFSALFKGDIDLYFGHKTEYWNENPRNQSLEIFANLSSMDVLNTYPDEKLLSDLFDVYKEIVNERID